MVDGSLVAAEKITSGNPAQMENRPIQRGVKCERT